MGRLIDEIEIYKRLRPKVDNGTLDDIMLDIPTVLTLPDNPTNGDMIKSIFNPYCIHEDKYYVYVYLTETEWNSGVYFNRFRAIHFFK